MALKEVKKLNGYEMAVVLKPLLPDDVRKSLHKEFVDMITKDGEGYYIIYTFKVSPKEILELKRQMELRQEVLRYMVVTIDDVTLAGKRIKKKEIEI